MKLIGVRRYWRNEWGHKPVLVWGAVKKVYIVYADHVGVRVLKKTKAELKFMEDIDYPVKTCAKQFRRLGREKSITKEAKNLLKGL